MRSVARTAAFLLTFAAVGVVVGFTSYAVTAIRVHAGMNS